MCRSDPLSFGRFGFERCLFQLLSFVWLCHSIDIKIDFSRINKKKAKKINHSKLLQTEKLNFKIGLSSHLANNNYDFKEIRISYSDPFISFLIFWCKWKWMSVLNCTFCMLISISFLFIFFLLKMQFTDDLRICRISGCNWIINDRNCDGQNGTLEIYMSFLVIFDRRCFSLDIANLVVTNFDKGLLVSVAWCGNNLIFRFTDDEWIFFQSCYTSKMKRCNSFL